MHFSDCVLHRVIVCFEDLYCMDTGGSPEKTDTLQTQMGKNLLQINLQPKWGYIKH